MLRKTVASEAEWIELYGRAAPRRDVEALIAAEHRGSDAWQFAAYCDVCERASSFTCDWLDSSGATPNFRERLKCSGCVLNSRQRLAFRLLREALGQGERSFYVYEQVTPLYDCFVQRFRECVVIGSEFLDPLIAPGTEVNGIRHEDALRLSFDDASFDAVVSNDVYEHVPDIEVAIGEACRVLRRSGTLIATVPFTFAATTNRRARLVGGSIEHLAEPIFHGNPLSKEGSLVFYDFGWDLLDLCKSSGFSDARFVCVHSFFRAYMGESLGLTLVASK